MNPCSELIVDLYGTDVGTHARHRHRCPVAIVAGMSGPDHGSGPAQVGTVAEVGYWALHR
jgi:hypothetical protein